MSDLIAVGYPDRETAETVRETLRRMTAEKVIELEDAVVVTRDDKGKVKLHQAVSTTATGATTGALWGGLIGLLFLAPLFGMAIGAATGAIGGAATDVGINDQFMKELGEALDHGEAALIVLVRSSTPEKVLPRIEQYGGHVIQTSLSPEAEERLTEALGARAGATA